MGDTAFEWLKIIAPSLITILLSGFLLQRFFVSKANQSSLIDSMLRDLGELNASSLEYWITAPSSKDKRDRLKLLAQKIKSGIKLLNKNLRHYSERYSKKEVESFRELMVELSDACTNGDFESSKKKSEPARQAMIDNATSRIRAALLKGKL